MSTAAATRADWLPGGKRYEKLNPFQKVDVVQDLLANELAKKSSTRDHNLVVDLEAEDKVWRRRATLMDPLWSMTHNLKITSEAEGLVDYKPRPIQEEFFSRIERNRAKKKPSFFVVPKPRKAGITTFVLLLFWVLTMHRSLEDAGRRTLVIAQKGDDLENIWDKVVTLRDSDKIVQGVPGGVKQFFRTNTKRALLTRTGNSKIQVRPAGTAVAEKVGAGRGTDVHYLLGTEVAFWTKHAINLMVGVMNSMPRPPKVWDTMKILESTGWGRDDYFAELCLMAHERPHESNCELFLLPWTELHDCEEALEDEDEEARMLEEILGRDGGELGELEHYLLVDRKCTLPQIKFFRSRVKDQPGDSMRDKIRNARREFPLDLNDALLASGTTTFDHEALTVQERRTTKCRYRGDLVAHNAPMWTRRNATGVVHRTPEPTFTGFKKYRRDGALEVWHPPQDGHQYIIAVDPSHGEQIGDPACMVVFDRTRCRIAAVWERGETDQEDLVEPCRLLSRWFNNGMIVVERNLGRLLIKWLKQSDRRKYLYKARDADETAQKKRTAVVYGIDMNQISKPVMIGFTRTALRDMPTLFTDPKMLRQMRAFRTQLNKDGTKELFPGVRAGSGLHDDRVICISMALRAHVELPMHAFVAADDGEAPTIAMRWDVKRADVKAKKKPKGARHPMLGVM